VLARREPERPLIHPNLAEAYRRKVAGLHEALADESTRAEAMERIRSLVDAIILVPENGVLRVEVQGELAAIFALAAQGKKSGRTDRALAEQIKMVAGLAATFTEHELNGDRRFKRTLQRPTR